MRASERVREFVCVCVRMRKEEWQEATAAQSPATITTTTAAAAATTRAMNIEATSMNAEVPQKYQASFHI